ncbi:MAG: DNA glycosylase [Lachnospiraceae bacterium]|nr:DNA glycosylase [Lachnospiraceae bacterium]
MNIYSEDKKVIIEDAKDFDIEDILECGQCFHFTRLDKKDYELMAYGRYLHIKQSLDDSRINRVVLYNTTLDDYNEIWAKYFDMEADYSDIKAKVLKSDDRLKEAVDAKAGIRILKQDFFETLISFIISQNKQIPHIKQIVHTISERYGDKLLLSDERTVYTFPSVERLYEVSEDELRECKVGFRAPYIRDAVCKVYSGEINEERLRGMSFNDARDELMTIKGVGEKVANCVLLYGLSFTNAFPVDVWMKRIMEYMYFGEDTKKEVIESFAYERYGEYAGYAQQYLFYYGRENGLGK